MNQASDIDILARGKSFPADWAKRLPDNSSPNSSVTLAVGARQPQEKLWTGWSAQGVGHHPQPQDPRAMAATPIWPPMARW